MNIIKIQNLPLKYNLHSKTHYFEIFKKNQYSFSMPLSTLNIPFKINHYTESYSSEFLNCKYVYYMFLSASGMHYMVLHELYKSCKQYLHYVHKVIKI